MLGFSIVLCILGPLISYNPYGEFFTINLALLAIEVFPIIFYTYISILFISIFFKDKSFVINKYSKFNFILEIIFLLLSISISSIVFEFLIIGSLVEFIKSNTFENISFEFTIFYAIIFLIYFIFPTYLMLSINKIIKNNENKGEQ